MTIMVSRSWPTLHPNLRPRPGAHPHSLGRGTGNFYTYPDEMWAAARGQHAELAAVGVRDANAGFVTAPGMEVRYEWVRGYPDGYMLMEGAVCSLDGHPEDFLPALRVTGRNPRRAIALPEDEIQGARA